MTFSLIRPKKVEYEISLDEIKQMIARDLKVDSTCIEVKYTIVDARSTQLSDPLLIVSNVRVTVDSERARRLERLSGSSDWNEK